MESNWQTYNVCKNCGHTVLPYDFIELLNCPMCGNKDSLNGWTKECRRWVSKSVWYKPWTWGNGFWETK